MINNIGIIRQRIFITENLNAIKYLTGINNIYRDSADIARIIRVLGDKLKIYIRMEKVLFCQYLYKSNDIDERELYKRFIDNSYNISVEYRKFKRKYDTGKKICSDIDEFKKDAQKIIRLMEEGLGIKKILMAS